MQAFNTKGTCCKGNSCFGKDYEGQDGLECLMGSAQPFILVRTDKSMICPCASDRSTGSLNCSRCFGTGKAIISLDKVPCYLSNSRPDRQRNLTLAGIQQSDLRLGYMGRWVYPQDQQYILEVGWNVDNDDVYKKGYPVALYNVFLIHQVNYIGFKEVAYAEAYMVLDNVRKESMENLLLFSKQLPPYVNRNK